MISLWLTGGKFSGIGINDFQPAGSLSTYKEKRDSEEETEMPATPFREMYNLRRYTQHEMSQCD